jgi:hypothetical protein
MASTFIELSLNLHGGRVAVVARYFPKNSKNFNACSASHDLQKSDPHPDLLHCCEESHCLGRIKESVLLCGHFMLNLKVAAFVSHVEL